MLRLTHAGRRGACRPRAEGADLPLRDGGWPLVSASPIPYTPRSAVPAELDEDGMERIRGGVRRGRARGRRGRLRRASSSTSARATCWARSCRRAPTAARTPTARTAAGSRSPSCARSATAFDGPLAVRLSPAADAVDTAIALREAGVDLIHVVSDQTTGASAPEYRRGHLTAFSDHIRGEAQVRTLAGGYLDTLDAVNTIVGAGRADLCLIEPAALS